jgi:ankyrin repeat protein
MSVDTQTIGLTSDILDTAYKKSELTHLCLNKAKRFLDEKYNNISQGLKINVLGVSLHNAKSRVETQTKICIQVVTDKGEKVQRWSHLKLPEVLVNTPKIRKSKYSNQYDDVNEESILNLDAMVVCASDLNKSAIHMCVGCVQRERKRSLKRDLKKNAVETAIDKEINNLMSEHENERIIIFNCNQIIEFGGGDCILPSRITCYCRHHKEKIGFCIYFVLRDHNGVVVATGLSPPILITDDHKSNSFKKNGRKRVKLEQQSALPPSPTLTSSSLTPPQSINENDNASPMVSQQNESSLLVDYTNNGIHKQSTIVNKTVPSNAINVPETTKNTPVNTIQYSSGFDMNITPLSPISSPEMNMNYSQQASYTTIASTSTSAINSIVPTLPNYNITNKVISPTTHGLDMNIKTETGLINEAQLNSLISGAQPQVIPMYSNIPNNAAAVVNNHLIVDQNIVIPSNSIAETMDTHRKLYNPNGYTINRMNQTLSSENAPYINKLIPSEGPLSGGIEVTVLGVNFMEGLVVVFGDTEAQTQFYSSSTLICILPPAQVPGPVPVAVKSYSFNIPIQNLMIFNYKNESDKQLMELALQVVGLRMTGKIDDARNIAMKIVSISDSSEEYNNKQDVNVESRNRAYSGISSDDPILKSSISILQRYIMDLNVQNKTFNNGVLEINSLENEVIQCLASIISPDEPFEEEEINLTTAAGQTLLHFAVLLNMTSLIKWLIALDIDIDSSDINGNTALHLAILMGNSLVVKILINNDADVYCENCNGKTPLDLAYELNNESIIDIIENVMNEEEEEEEEDNEEEEEEDNENEKLYEMSSEEEDEELEEDEEEEEEEEFNIENEKIKFNDVSNKNENEKIERENVIENIDNLTPETTSRSVNYFKSSHENNKVKQRKSQQNLNINKNIFEKENYYTSEVETDIYDAKPVETDLNDYSHMVNEGENIDSQIISPEVALNKIKSKYKLLQKDLPQYAMSLFSGKDKNSTQTKSEISWFQNIQQMPNFMNFSTITAFNFSFTNPFPLVTQHWNDLRKKQFEEWRRNQSLYTLLKRDSSAVIVHDDLEEEKKKDKVGEPKQNEKKSSSSKKTHRYMRLHYGRKGNKENYEGNGEKENSEKENGEKENSEKDYNEENDELFEDLDDYDYDEYIENGLFENDPRLTERERRLLAKQKHSRENRKRLRRDRTLFLFWIPTILVMVALALLRVYTFRKIVLETVNTLVLIPLGLEPYEIITVNHDQDLGDIINII